VSIFVILFLILAVDKNPKYYIATAILLVIAIFTKYVAFFLLPLFLLYYLSKHDFFNTVDLFLTNREEFKEKSKAFLKSKEFKYIILALIIFVALFLLFCGLIISYNGGLTFITQISESNTGFSGGKYTLENGYEPSTKFYVKNFNNMTYADFTGNLDISWILPIIILIGIVFNLKNLDIQRPKKEFKFKHMDKILYILIVAMFAIALFEFKKINMISNIAILVSYVCMFSLLDKYGIDKDKYGMTFLFLGWLSVFFIYFSYIHIKMLRYFIVVVPPFVYFIVWSCEGILAGINNKKIIKILIIIFMAVLMIHAVTYVSNEKFDNKRNSTDIENVLDYLNKIDPDYDSKNIYSNYSYYSRYTKWYLKTDVCKYLDDMDGENGTYIIARAPVDFPEFKKIHKSGRVILYQNTSQPI
jgi:flagellar basal body-associated protein FliL